MLLRDYQNRSVERLSESCERLLKSPENEICVFQAPTGSGKTIIVAEFLKNLVKNRKDQRKFSFIWVSVRKLHDQSKDKLEKYYDDDRLLTCSYFEDLIDKKLGENEILFINWHSINKKDINIYVKDNEQDNNLSTIIRNTKDDGREIILIIDESHHTAKGEKSKELIDVISPKITLEVSATPHLKENVSEFVKIHLNEVKEEEMIKSEISINPEFKNIKIGSKSADLLVIEQALKKRDDLLKMYQDKDSDVNPLMLIQLPDKKEGMEDKKDEVVKILEKFNITEKNGKLAIWLSEDKSDTLPNIEKNNNEVEVLIFKQAIAVGWDCPRASILVIFRETKDFDFTIQTIGRIMRMPELKYYTKNTELNRGFVFTNLENIEITEDYVKDYVTVYESKRQNDVYDELSLTSYYLKRRGERTRLSGEFSNIFLKTASDIGLKSKITLKPSKITNSIISDGRLENIDKIGEIEHDGTVQVGSTTKEIQTRFDNFITLCCTPFAPKHSSDRMKTAIYQFLQKEFEIEKYSSEAQKLVLGEENWQHFVNCINKSKAEYKKKVVEPLSEKREVQVVENWEVPLLISYNSRYQQLGHGNSIMSPLFVKSPSEPEKKFMEALSVSKKVKWWFKNGETEIKYFAVKYDDENGFSRGFYVDFIVMFKDGKLGLFDTKSGSTTEGAGSRAEGLQKYIKSENKKGKKLFGGIVIYEDGSFWINQRDKYHYDPHSRGKDWEILEV